MADITKKRDRHFQNVQNLLGSAMTELGTVISMILNEEEEGVDKAILLENLCNAGRLMADIHHSQINSQKSVYIFDSGQTSTSISRQLTHRQVALRHTIIRKNKRRKNNRENRENAQNTSTREWER